MVMVEHYPRKNAEAKNLMYKTYHLNTFPTLCTLFYSRSMCREKGLRIQEFNRANIIIHWKLLIINVINLKHTNTKLNKLRFS